jgi:hypothetical protein
MPSFIIVEKNGSVKCTTSKTLNISDLYKKCGFKSNDGFNCAHTWTIELNEVEYKIQVYGKTNGRAGSENKYEFPPPIDNTLFFGSVVLVNMDHNQMVDLTMDSWNQVYEYLFGGFEDLHENDSEDEVDTDDEIEELERAISLRKGKQVEIKRTKQGYAKDGFIVDDDEDEDEQTEYSETEDDNDDNTDSDKEVPQIAPTNTRKSKRLAKKPKEVYTEEPEETGYLDCTSELEEEEYI